MVVIWSYWNFHQSKKYQHLYKVYMMDGNASILKQIETQQRGQTDAKMDKIDISN